MSTSFSLATVPSVRLRNRLIHIPSVEYATCDGSPPSLANTRSSRELLKCTPHQSRSTRYRVCLPVCTLTPASQKTWLRGVCRSNHTVFPSQLHHSWPLISMSIVRLCIRRIAVPSVRIVQVRSSSCHVP